MAISWMHSIQFYLTVNKTSYNTNMKKIMFALSYMTDGSPLTWTDTFQENMITGAAITLRTWDDFLRKFQEMFKHQDTIRNAISWLSTHYMTKKNRKFSLSLKSYISTFQSNTTHPGIMDHNVLISLIPLLWTSIWSNSQRNSPQKNKSCVPRRSSASTAVKVDIWHSLAPSSLTPPRNSAFDAPGRKRNSPSSRK